MKLFQQMLVAPAALGLLAPMAANAAELNIDAVSDYSSAEQVTSVSQFSDVHPADWAHQALISLAENSGCKAVAPTGSMTRFEAASLLNSCLESVAEATDEVRRLINEFAPELALIKGRVDGLEARVGEFEAGQFSSTTKLRGKAIFNLGGLSYDDRDKAGLSNDAIHLNYTWQAALNTSFTGKDLLYTRLKTGNFNSDTFADTGAGTYLTAANKNGDTVKVDKLWYTFPVGEHLKVWVGPKVENYYMLASSPSIYKPVLKSLKLGGNGAIYGASTGQGFGAAWTQNTELGAPRFAVSTNYVSKNGSKADASSGGLMTDGAQSYFLSKVEYGSPRWQVSAAYAYKSDEAAKKIQGFGTKAGRDWEGEMTGVGLRAYWKPEEAGAIPSISVGYDIADIEGKSTGDTTGTNAWMAGLTWKDAFVAGNQAGLAIGSTQYQTEKKGGGDTDDDNFIAEAWYSFKVSDNVSVTPAVFVVNDVESRKDGSDIFGAVVQTQFRF